MNWRKQAADTEMRASSQPHSLRLLTGLVMGALLVRLAMLFGSQYMIGPDGTEYANLGAQFAAGEFRAIFNPYWPPLYPFLIGITTLVINRVELAAQFVSVVSGSLLVLPVFWLTRNLYGEAEALVAALLVIFYALLVWFSVQVLTESTYLLIFSFALVTGWKALAGHSAPFYFLTGLLFSACYLLRPEAAGYLGVMTGMIFIVQVTSARQQKLTNVVFFTALLLIGFLALSAPYLFYLRAITGGWTLSAKFGRHLLGGNIYRQPSFMALPLGARITKYFLRLIFALEKEHKVFPQVFAPPLMLLTGLGLFRTRWDKQLIEKQIYLFIFFLATVFAYALTVVEFRYLLPLLPILFCWLAKGITEFEKWLVETVVTVREMSDYLLRYSPVIRAGVLAVIMLYLAPTIVIVQTDAFLWKNTPLELKYAGAWIKEHQPNNKVRVIMSSDKRTAFYAQGQHVSLPESDFDTMLAQARANAVDYIVLNESWLRQTNSPLQSLLTNLAANADELELLYQEERRAQRKVMIFRVRQEGERVVK